jgi:hypothetical protein
MTAADPAYGRATGTRRARRLTSSCLRMIGWKDGVLAGVADVSRNLRAEGGLSSRLMGTTVSKKWSDSYNEGVG